MMMHIYQIFNKCRKVDRTGPIEKIRWLQHIDGVYIDWKYGCLKMQKWLYV